MSEFNKRLRHMREVLGKKRYLSILVPLSMIYLVFSFGTVVYIHGGINDFYYAMYPSYTITFTILTILISVLMGFTLTLFIAKIKEIKAKSAGLGVSGIVVGSLAAGCPGCFFGLFPLFLSAFGISATLAVLPFNGLELQAISIPILLFAIWELGKETDLSCKINAKRTK